MKRTYLFLLIGMVVIGAFLAGCTQQASTAPAQALKIGVVASLTGPSSTTGKDVWQSAQLCGR